MKKLYYKKKRVPKRKQLPMPSINIVKPNIILSKDGYPTCEKCGREMTPLEFGLRKGECVVCKTAREMELL